MQKMNIDKAEKTLGLIGEYGEAELKAAYRKMISEYHPDKFATQPDTMKQLTAEKLRKVNEANSILKKKSQMAGEKSPAFPSRQIHSMHSISLHRDLASLIPTFMTLPLIMFQTTIHPTSP